MPAWEEKVTIDAVQEIRTKTTVFFGVGALNKINDVAATLKHRGVDKVIIVTYPENLLEMYGKWNVLVDALKAQSIGWVMYSGVAPNPTADQVDEAAAMAREAGAKAVIAIGGGSAIDAGKSVAMLLAYPGKNARQIYEHEFIPEKAAPIVAINLTHGTGSEADRFGVVSIPEKEFKPAVALDCIYPLYAIDDPSLCVGLPANQTRWVSVDAVNHAMEAATSTVATPYSIQLAKDSIRLVATYLPKALEDPKDLRARYFLMYAAMIAGVAFDNGLLHITHAMEHPLSALKPNLPHGLGLAMMQPSVVKAIYPAVPEVLADILAPLAPGLKGTPDEAEKAAKLVEKWLFSVGVTEKLSDAGFTEDQVDRLTELSQITPALGLLLSVGPIPPEPETIANIYRESMKPLH